MTVTIPDTEPTSFAAGDTVAWRRALTDYRSADGWSLQYAIRGKTALNTITGVDDGAGTYTVTLPAAAAPAGSGGLAAGTYTWIAFVTRGAAETLERYTVARGTFAVTPDLAALATYQTHAEKALALVEAAIEGRVVSDEEAHTILGRSITRVPLEQLVRMRNAYKLQVVRERNGGRLPMIRLRFGNAG